MIKKIKLMKFVPVYGRSEVIKEYGRGDLDQAFKDAKLLQATDTELPNKRYWVKIIYND